MPFVTDRSAPNSSTTKNNPMQRPTLTQSAIAFFSTAARRSALLHLSAGLLAALMFSSSNATAQTAAPSTLASTATAAMSEAEVRKVDVGVGKLTLKHGDIKNLDMPPMTMVFQVKDPALLSLVKAGDKVRFTADKINGAYTVLTLERSP